MPTPRTAVSAALGTTLTLGMAISPALAATTAASTTTASTTLTSATTYVPYKCELFGGVEAKVPVSAVLKDTYAWSRFAAVRVGNGYGNINWKLDPYAQPSWRINLHSLRWMGQAINAWVKAPAANQSAYKRVLTVTQDWIRDNPQPWAATSTQGASAMYRAQTLTCLRYNIKRLTGAVPSWLDASLRQHAAWLKGSDWQAYNIGIDRSLALLDVACTLGDRPYADIAATRLETMLGRVVDSEGASTEQSTMYTKYSHGQWGRAQVNLAQCGFDELAGLITARRTGMQRFIEHSIAPNNRLWGLGDSPNDTELGRWFSPVVDYITSGGRYGAPLQENVAIFRQAGFAFGRSGWGTAGRTFANENAYSLRFGPVRYAHGHHDHMSLTWSTMGRQIIVDPGLSEYANDAWRIYTMSPAAHNLVMVGNQLTTLATQLVRENIAPKAHFYDLRDKVPGGGTRARSVLFLTDPDVVIVYDKATGPSATSGTTFTQLWHLPPGRSVTVTGGNVVASTGTDTLKTRLIQVGLPGLKPAPGGVVTGATKPVQGWYWINPATRRTAPVVSFKRTGTSARFVTILGATTGTLGYKIVSTTAEGTTLDVTSGGKTARILITADSALSRLP